MRFGRLFEIIYILLSKKTVTASELAEYFEVSQRTIYRDVETLSESGIPIFTSKGKGGGIALLDNFVLNKSLLTEKEKSDILSALMSTKAITMDNTHKQTFAKLSSFFGIEMEEWIDVDFSGWGDSEDNSFEIMKTCILQRKVLRFTYYNANGEKSQRYVEPMLLKFKHRSWYLEGFCQEKQAVRIFKLNRIRDIEETDTFFVRKERKIQEEKPKAYTYTNEVTLKFRIVESQGYRVYDEFEQHQIERLESGDFVVTVTYPEDEWVYGFILSFGCYIEVLEPPHVREIIRERISRMQNYYS